MATRSDSCGKYSPLKKRPAIPPEEFFKQKGGYNIKSAYLKPRELAVLCYAHFDGRSNLKQKTNREP